MSNDKHKCDSTKKCQENKNRLTVKPSIIERQELQLKDAIKTIENKDVIIKMLQEQVKKLEENYKQNLNETEEYRLKYCKAIQQVESMRSANSQREGSKQMLRPSNTKNNAQSLVDIQKDLGKWKNQCEDLLKYQKNEKTPCSGAECGSFPEFDKFMCDHYETFQMLVHKIAERRNQNLQPPVKPPNQISKTAQDDSSYYSTEQSQQSIPIVSIKCMKKCSSNSTLGKCSEHRCTAAQRKAPLVVETIQTPDNDSNIEIKDESDEDLPKKSPSRVRPILNCLRRKSSSSSDTIPSYPKKKDTVQEDKLLPINKQIEEIWAQKASHHELDTKLLATNAQIEQLQITTASLPQMEDTLQHINQRVDDLWLKEEKTAKALQQLQPKMCKFQELTQTCLQEIAALNQQKDTHISVAQFQENQAQLEKLIQANTNKLKDIDELRNRIEDLYEQIGRQKPVEPPCSKLNQTVSNTSDNQMQWVHDMIAYYSRVNSEIMHIRFCKNSCPSKGGNTKVDGDCLKKYIERMIAENVKMKTTITYALDTLSDKLTNIETVSMDSNQRTEDSTVSCDSACPNKVPYKAPLGDESICGELSCDSICTGKVSDQSLQVQGGTRDKRENETSNSELSCDSGCPGRFIDPRRAYAFQEATRSRSCDPNCPGHPGAVYQGVYDINNSELSCVSSSPAKSPESTPNYSANGSNFSEDSGYPPKTGIKPIYKANDLSSDPSCDSTCPGRVKRNSRVSISDDLPRGIKTSFALPMTRSSSYEDVSEKHRSKADHKYGAIPKDKSRGCSTPSKIPRKVAPKRKEEEPCEPNCPGRQAEDTKSPKKASPRQQEANFDSIYNAVKQARNPTFNQSSAPHSTSETSFASEKNGASASTVCLKCYDTTHFENNVGCYMDYLQQQLVIINLIESQIEALRRELE